MKSNSLIRLCVAALFLAVGILAHADSPGPATKRTSLVIFEVMYHPLDRADGKNLEFVEIYNSEAVPIKLGGFRLAGDIAFTFPEGTVIGGTSFVTVAAAPADLQAVYGLSQPFGPFSGVLPNGGGRIELWSKSGGLLLELDYRDDAAWPASADGGGHSLVLARPTYGQNEVKAWSASALIGGSPGASEPATPATFRSILINEILAHTDDPVEDYIELYNRTNVTVSLSGCILTDDAATNKFVITGDLGAYGFLHFKQSQLGFALSAAGETIYLKDPTGTRIIDAVKFGGQANGVAIGRFPNGAPEWYPQSAQTPGAPNAGLRQSPVVINEIMYSPVSEDDEDEYVELYNWSAAEIDLSGWELDDGIEFTIPSGTKIAADGYLVIAKNAARMLTRYTNLNALNLVGNFSGKLAGSGERVVLTMPDTTTVTNTTGVVQTQLIHIAMDEVTYGTGGRWNELADEGGSSLELIDPRANHRLASNWDASDETRKAPWTTVEYTGTLDNGAGAANQLQMHMQGPGECLVDNVEAFNAGGANLIANSTFETGVAGWTAEGTQDTSGAETAEGYLSARSYHLRAVDRGDTGANRIRTPLTSSMTIGAKGTIRAQVRWLKGRPEMLLRLRGNYLEAIGKLTVPTNLGTPGARNSRAAANVGPAIYDVIHSPVLPAANQAFIVTARIDDPDGASLVQVTYRVDGTAATGTIAMNDSGSSGDVTPGDGVYTATIPGAASGSIVAFYVRATDTPGLQTRFPADAPTRECLVRIGEVQPNGPIGTYRLWMTAATRSTWTSRHPLNNTPLDTTFVYGNERVIYNMKALYAGSPYIAPGYNGPTGGLCGYTGEFPKDDLFLGVNDFVLDWPGRDPAAVGETMSYLIADEMGLPNSHRRFIHLHVNGVNEQTRGSVYEDVQQPGGDLVSEWSPGDANGNFYKVERWFEFSDTISLLSDPMPQLANFTTDGGAKKLAAYRWNFLPRAVVGSVNNFDDIFAWADAANAAAPEPYTSQMEALTDMEEVMGIFAIERIISNFDSWGHAIGKNMYAYKPRQGRWMTFMFDNDWLMTASTGNGYGPTSALFTPVNDPAIARMSNHPPFRRAYFRNIRRAIDVLSATNINPMMDARYAMLQASGVTRSAGSALTNPDPLKTWLSQRRAFLITQLDALNAPFAITSNGGNDFSSPTNVVALTGTAPIDVKEIRVNGVVSPVTWTADTTWTLPVILDTANEVFTVQAFAKDGSALGSDAITVTFTGTLETIPGRIVFNEIMYHPPTPGASFIELKSLATTTSFDLSHWRIEGVGYTFPAGTILPPGGYLVIAKDRAAFAAAYGTSVTLAGEFPGQLQNDSETLWLIKPGATAAADAVIDQITYSDQAPWPAAADGLGASLQLIDAAQDNSRAINWAAQPPSTNTVPPQKLIAIDNAWKYNESGVDLGAAWMTNTYNDSAWLSGNALLYVEGSALPGPKNTPLNIGRTTYYFRTHFNFTGDPTQVALNLSTVIDDGAVIYLNGQELHRVGMDDPISYATLSSRLVDNAALEGPTSKPSTWLRVGDNVIAAEVHQNNAGSSDIVFGLTLDSAPLTTPIATPGIANSVARPLPAFPNVWINEINPVNLTGIADEFGQRDPWVELYNAGPTTVSLNGWALSDSATNLTRWAFPASAQIAAGQRLLVWLDAQTGTSELHTSFRAAAGTGTLALIFPFDGMPSVLDYVNYSGVPNDRSLGRFPDGDNSGFQLFFTPTPGAANNNAAPTLPLFINEWMASNSIIADPSDHDFDDWFEIYNPNNVAIDLTGYALTDNLTDPRERSIIPAGWRIEPGQFMLVWADGESPTNATELHVNFNLARAGESIALYAPNGTLVDSVTFATQTNNISQGRALDAGAEFRFFTTPTPRASNSPSADFRIISATLDAAAHVIIQWEAQPGKTYEVQFKTAVGDAAWVPLTEATAAGVTAQITDSISQSVRFYRVVEK